MIVNISKNKTKTNNCFQTNKKNKRKKSEAEAGMI